MSRENYPRSPEGRTSVRLTDKTVGVIVAPEISKGSSQGVGWHMRSTIRFATVSGDTFSYSGLGLRKQGHPSTYTAFSRLMRRRKSLPIIKIRNNVVCNLKKVEALP